MAKNLKIITQDLLSYALNPAATLAASSTAAGSVEYLRNDIKGQFHRSSSADYLGYSVTFGSATPVSGVVIPACNLTASAEMSIYAYDQAGNIVGVAGGYAVQGKTLDLWDWGQPINGNAFAYGGATVCSMWFEQTVVAKSLVVNLADPTNPAGYIDVARLVVGEAWSPLYNADYGVSREVQDSSENTRNHSGDLISRRGFKHDVMTLDLKYMPSADRARVMQMLRSNGNSKNIAISLLPGSTDTLAEQDMTIYGKLDPSALRWDYFDAHSTQITIQGW